MNLGSRRALKRLKTQLVGRKKRLSLKERKERRKVVDEGVKEPD
jgi:hypothetical protein